MDPISFAIKAIIWIFTVTINLGPWLTENLFMYIVAPMVGRERLLRMGRETTIPISMFFLGAFWGGVWLLFWGALGAGDLAMWGVIFGVVSGWRAGVYIADGLEEARIAIVAEESDPSTTGSVPEQRIDNRAGRIDSSGFSHSHPPDDEPQPTGRE